MTLRHAMLLLWLSCGAIACGASASDVAITGSAGNACEKDADCGDGACVAKVCTARSNGVDYVVVEISPPVGVASGEYGNVRYLRAEQLGAGGILDVDLDVVAELTVAVAPPNAACAALGVDSSGNLPIAVQVLADSGIHRIAPVNIQGASGPLGATNAQGNAVSLVVAPGPVDLYIEPTMTASGPADAAVVAGACDLAPLLVRGQPIAPGLVSLNQRLPAAEHVSVDVVVPLNGSDAFSLEGWVLDMVEPLEGRRLSSRAVLSTFSGGKDGQLHQELTLAFHPVMGTAAEKLAGTELFRLSPPVGLQAPTFYIARSAMDLFDAGKVVLSQVTALPTAVIVQGLVESEVDNTPVRSDIVATLDSNEAASLGALASYRVTTSTDADGHFQLALLSGNYHVVALPAASTPYALQSDAWTVAPSPAVQAGKLIRLGAMATLTGVVHSGSKAEAVAGATVAVSPSSFDRRPTFLDELLGPVAATEVRNQTAVADERGTFEIPIDPGRFDVTIRPGDGSGFPWAIRPSVVVDSGAKATLSVEVRNPIAYTGRVTVPGHSAGAARVALPGTLLRFYAVFTDAGQLADGTVPAVSALEIGHSRTDSGGNYELLLPDRLD